MVTGSQRVAADNSCGDEFLHAAEALNYVTHCRATELKHLRAGFHAKAVVNWVSGNRMWLHQTLTAALGTLDRPKGRVRH